MADSSKKRKLDAREQNKTQFGCALWPKLSQLASACEKQARFEAQNFAARSIGNLSSSSSSSAAVALWSAFQFRLKSGPILQLFSLLMQLYPRHASHSWRIRSCASQFGCTTTDLPSDSSHVASFAIPSPSVIIIIVIISIELVSEWATYIGVQFSFERVHSLIVYKIHTHTHSIGRHFAGKVEFTFGI